MITTCSWLLVGGPPRVLVEADMGSGKGRLLTHAGLGYSSGAKRPYIQSGAFAWPPP